MHFLEYKLKLFGSYVLFLRHSNAKIRLLFDNAKF